MKPIITVKNISKKYTIMHQRAGYVTLRDSIANIFKHGPRSSKSKEVFWALKDINFTVNKGEVVGIIGHNGAGKSTLLKILSQITPPTTGEIIINGRVGSLLEVGTGFHPELSGRENIFLNGAILGMKKKEIAQKFDEIVAFAGIEKFLDTPVKHYSSGMYVRLAFSVAAHMEPDILIIDEVLAVGDAEFQKKCLGKMDEITKKDGKTIIFVSHNLEAIKDLCQKCILLKGGEIVDSGPTQIVLDSYAESLQLPQTGVQQRSFTGPLSRVIEITTILINKGQDESISPLTPMTFDIQGFSKEVVDDFQLTFSLYHNETRLMTLFDVASFRTMTKGSFTSHFTLPEKLFRPGTYSIAIGGQTASDNRWFYGTHVFNFHITEKFVDTNDANAIGIINIPYQANRTQDE
jgi:lipopolysaccharide transport system ATP-binding protein